MIIFPDKYTVGFQKRKHDNKTLEKGGNYPFGFFTLDVTLSSWTGWRDHTLQPLEVMNTPRNGFRVYGQTKRDGGWNGSGRSMVYIQHADEFIWEITVENLVNILDTCDIVDGEFTDKMIIGKEGKNYVLVPEKSEVYQEYLRLKGQPKQKKKATDLVSGDVVMIGKSQWIFVGNFDCIETVHDFNNRELYVTNCKKGNLSLFMQTIKDKNVFRNKNLNTLKNLEFLGNKVINKNKIIIDNNLLTYDQKYEQGYNGPGIIPILEGATNFAFYNSTNHRMMRLNYTYDQVNVIDIDNFVVECKFVDDFQYRKKPKPFINYGISMFKQDYNGVTYETSI